MRWRSRSLPLATSTAALVAAPYAPADDGAVLERLPEALRSGAGRTEADAYGAPGAIRTISTIAARVGAALHRGGARNRRSALPRPGAGGACAVVDAADAPPAALLLRATVKQSQHDFDGALADLDRLLARSPGDGAGAADARHGADGAGPLRRRAARLHEAAHGSRRRWSIAGVPSPGASSLNGDAAARVSRPGRRRWHARGDAAACARGR